MNISRLIANASLLAMLGSASIAQAGDSEIYRYGMALDIAKVLSIEVAPAAYCSVVNAHMTYVNSSGEVRGLDYLVQAAACDASG
ncbi:DUF2790 domain-containing protein [Pseudomonas sp. PDM16]|uniref:DUF2790 domain-containing protein n=1 Tax=Pseudomonas sp. PDM16 TaxID=2769292 RepID=UPI00178313BA|nr:DUF2790 domain-containing protein [Pseudomonas sp. PDM16]MBD9416120.1 DUF2790 domain-containing protein [Pseudomonas sp. PDM16]